MSDIRYDLIHHDYVLIAPERLHRPDCYKIPQTSRPNTDKCPFCEGHESMTPSEIYALRHNAPNQSGWKTRVVPNLYKAVQIETPCKSLEVGHYEAWEGFGAHEVIIDTPRHLLRMDGWEEEEYFNWLFTLRSRMHDLRNDFRLVYFSLFKNHGHYAASTQTHPHTQLIALPVVPKQTITNMLRAKHFFLEHGHSLFDAVLALEREHADRIIIENDHFIAICPYASAFAFEVMILSKTQTSTLMDMEDTHLHELGNLLQKVIKALYHQLGDFDFNITFNTPPIQKNFATESFFDEIPNIWRFGLRIIPRLFNIGGFELHSGVYINPVAPEEATGLLRGSL
ncbi:MAG: galactose-1-phosphate uridylyltransferase [Hydrogenimonas sp.]|nr:MAG: galactose-1-phosphate uridylyltransferase [Hydrogenimonas sp.]